MPATLPIPAQVPFEPVTNYYKGEAIRQGLATAKKEEELLDMQIEAAKNPQPDPKEQRDALDFVNDGIAEAGAAAITLVRSNPDATPEEITATFDSYLSRLLPQEAFDKVKAGYDKNGDGLIGPEELSALEAHSIARGKLEGGEEDAPSDYTLDKGRYSGVTNELIAGIAPTAGSDSSRQRDDEIRDAEAIFRKDGHPDPHRAAIEFVDDGFQVLISPSDNTVYKRNKFTDKLEIMRPEDNRGPPPEIPYEDTLHALAEDATGFGPTIKAAIAKGTAPADIESLRAEKQVAAKAKFKAAENSLIEAFRLNPRYPQTEITRIQGNIDIKPKFWDSPFQMRTRMSGSRDFLTEKLEMLEYYLQDPGATSTRKENDARTRDGIRDYLRVLGEAPSAAPELKDLPPVPEGVDPEDWRYYTPEARERASQ